MFSLFNPIRCLGHTFSMHLFRTFSKLIDIDNRRFCSRSKIVKSKGSCLYCDEQLPDLLIQKLPVWYSMYLRDRVPEIVSLSGVTFVLKDLVYISRWLLLIQQPLLTQYSPSTHSVIFWICVSVRRFERFEFLSEKINFAALGGSKLSSFEPDTSHP